MPYSTRHTRAVGHHVAVTAGQSELLLTVSFVALTSGALFGALAALALRTGQAGEPERARRGLRIWLTVAVVGTIGCCVAFILR
jgi:hypothetical protein